MLSLPEVNKIRLLSHYPKGWMHWSGCCSTYSTLLWLTLLHCSTKRWEPVCGGPKGPRKHRNDSPSQERPRSSSELVEMSLYSFPFYFVPLARCWIDTAVSVGAEHRSLSQSAHPRGDERGKRAICLEQHSLSCTKNAETDRRCTDLCQIHSRARHDVYDGL